MPAHTMGNHDSRVAGESTAIAAGGMAAKISALDDTLVDPAMAIIGVFVALTLVETKMLESGFTTLDVPASEIEFVGKGRSGPETMLVGLAGEASFPAVEVMA